MKRIIFAISIVLMATTVKAQCVQKIQIESILVDACNNSALEPNNEMVRFKNGSNSLNISQISIAGAPASGIFAANKWPTNGLTWNGLIQSATTASVTAALQATVVSSCGILIEPPGGVIPANVDVLMICSDDPSITDNSFANLIDTLYIVYHNATYTVTTGHFVNYTTPSSTRGLIIFDNAHGCSDTVIYDPSLLSGHNNGDAVAYDAAGNATYYNDGCQAAFVPIQVTASGPASACGTVSLSGVISGPAASYSWTTSGTGVFSVSTGTLNVSSTTTVTSTYTLGVGESGTVTFTLTAQGTCPGATATSTIAVTINPAPTPTISSSNGTSICNGDSTILSVNNQAGTTYSWAPGGSTATSITVTPTNTATPTVYTVSASSSCGTTQATFTVTVNPAPIFSLTGNSYSLCAGGTQTFTVSGASTYTWTPAATLTNPNTANPTASPTTTTVYSVTGTNAGGCTNTTPATVTVTVNPTLTYSLTSNAFTICSGDAQTFTVSGASTYTWTPAATLTGANTANPTANPTTTTVYSVTGTNVGGCTNTTPATVTVTVNSTLTYSLTGNAFTICSGGSQTFTVSGASTYTWTPSTTLTGANTANPTANPTTTTIYSVTGTNASGCTNTTPAIVTVNVTTTPTLSLTANSYTICNGSSQTFTVSGASIYTWNPAATLTGANTANPIANPTTTTIYTVNGTASGCAPSSPLTLTLTVNPLPTYSLSSNTYTICSGSSQTFTVSGASTYTWTPAATLTNPNTANPTASPTTTTVYNATGTNLGGCTNTAPATVTVVVNPLPTLTVTPNSPSICLGQGSATLTASGANSYTWSTTATTSSITVSPSSTQTYSVIGTDANGCISSIMAIATVSVNMPPTITINSSTGASVCIGGATTLTALNAQTYTWDNGTISNTNAVNPTINPTTYTVVGTDANGCIGVAMQSITVNSLPTVNINPSSLAVCTGNSATLTAIGAQTYTWDSGSTANPLLVNPTTNPTTYTVTGTDANGCIGTATQSITVNPAPTININATSPSICLGQGNSTLTASGANSYTWNTTATTASIIVSPSSTLTYSVMGTDASGCISSTSATTTITVNPLPTITITPNPTSVCAGATTTLTASGATTYTWNNGTTLNTNVVSPTINPTTYSVNGTDINGCKDSNTVSISVNQPPTAQTVRDTFVCKGSTTTLTETNSSYTYYWTGPAPSTATVSTSSSIGITQGGIYTLHTTNSCGDIPTTFSVTKDSLKPSFVASPTTGIVPVSVSFTNTSTGNTLTYNWNFGDGDNSTSINPTENYTSVGIFQAILTATDNVGCTDTASIKIKVNEIPTVLVIPNVFTPNGDNINDIFFITATGISNLDCKVYDRWGLLLHEWTGIGGGWDGKGKNGNYCTDGVYFYLITYDDNQGKLCKKDDYFELIR